jgi:hypothetical protein
MLIAAINKISLNFTGTKEVKAIIKPAIRKIGWLSL